MKKLIALVIAGIMVLGLAACGTGTSAPATTAAPAETNEATAAETEAVGNPDAEDVINVIVHDGDATKITDAAFNDYFGGDALEGVKKLLAEGKVYVNGIKVPATEDETSDYQVNGVSSLYKTSSGWGYNVHKTTSPDNLSFEDARLGFFETITTVRGHETTLYGDAASCVVNKIDSQSYDVFRITYFEDHGGQVDKIDRGEFELETNRIRPDVRTVTVSSDNFDSNIAIGDIVCYYYGPSGWVMNKAETKEGKITKNENKEFVVNDGEYVCIESNVSRYNLIDSNRPTQFFTAYNRLGLSDLSIIMWDTPTGHPICFTYGGKDAAKAALTLAIENAKAAKDGVAVSVDGTDVPKGTMWAAQADFDAYDEAIASAEAVLASNSTAVYEYDGAIYALSLALGEGGEKPSGFVGAQGEGSQG